MLMGYKQQDKRKNNEISTQTYFSHPQFKTKGSLQDNYENFDFCESENKFYENGSNGTKNLKWKPT